MMNEKGLKQTVDDLKIEVKQLTKEALANSGDKAASWQRAHEINELMPELKEQASAITGTNRLVLEADLLELEYNLIFLTADQNKPDELKTEPETLEQSVRLLYAESFELAKKYSGIEGDHEAMQKRGQEMQRERDDLLRRGGSQDPELQRLLSEASLDIDYVARGGNSPMSTRLAYYLMEMRQQGSR
jgi:hypothetical protein